MKRRILLILCICLLLSGCQTPVQTTEPTTVPTTAGISVPLLEQGTALEEDASLLYIPCDFLEQMSFPELDLIGNAVLLSGFDVNSMDLKLISLEDGALVAEAAVPAAPATTVFVGTDGIGLCDIMSGKVTILDEKLRIVKSYSIAADGDDWYLDPGLDTLYIFTADRGLVSVELETGAETCLVDNGFRVFCKGRGDDCLIFSYVDRADQKTYNRCLNMSTGALEPLPIKGAILVGTRVEDTWLLQHNEADGLYTLVCDGAAASFTWTDSDASLLPVRQELLVSDLSGRNLMLYGIDGCFHSGCALPSDSEAFLASELLWSEYWGGYFFADFTGSSCRLMFWDVQESTAGERLEILSEGDAQPPAPLLEPGLYARAAEMSQRFGVEIRIGEQCARKYTHYETAPLTDPLLVAICLDTLEDSLSQYPDGFFAQLCYDSVETICIEVVDGLSIREDGLIHPSTASGVAQKQGTRYTVALDGNMINNETIYHEIAHIISARLEWDALIREDAMYSEDAWMALQPEGFSYAMVYRDVPEEYQQYIDAGYFINEYSMTFSTEDRSEVMSEAMSLEHWRFEKGTGLRSKLQFYADCIRDCFDTTGWPEVTRWERVLG